MKCLWFDYSIYDYNDMLHSVNIVTSLVCPLFFFLMKFVQCTGNEPNSFLAESLKVTFHNYVKKKRKRYCNSVDAKWMWI